MAAQGEQRNFNVIKLFNMKFTSIPTNGSSWREPLVYQFTTENTEPEDVAIEIIDISSGNTLGEMILYGITTGEVDIAPYVAYKCSLTPTWSTRQISMQRSPSAKMIRVKINGLTSADRLFFRSKINTNTIGALSSNVQNNIIEKGGAWRLTMYAKNNVVINMSCSSSSTSPISTSITTSGYPVELMFSTSAAQVGDTVKIEATYDNSTTQTFTYKVIAQGASSKVLIWYNPNGGIEQHLFDHSIKMGYCVDVTNINNINSLPLREVHGRLRSRLCSGYNTSDTIRRISQILLSPVIFTDKERSTTMVELETHEITFNDKGELHSITLDISEEWEGGEL